MQLDKKKNSLASIFLKILYLFVSKTYQILFVQFGMYVLCAKRKVQWLFTYQNGKFEVWYVFCFWMGRKIRYKYIPYFNNTFWYVQGEKSDWVLFEFYIPNIICTIWYVCFVCKEEILLIIYIPKCKYTIWYVKWTVTEVFSLQWCWSVSIFIPMLNLYLAFDLEFG